MDRELYSNYIYVKYFNDDTSEIEEKKIVKNIFDYIIQLFNILSIATNI